MEKFVLYVLAERANAEAICWPSQSMLAEECQIAERTVRSILKRLEEAGHITVRRAAHRSDKGVACLEYVVHPIADPTEDAPTPAPKKAISARPTQFQRPIDTGIGQHPHRHLTTLTPAFERTPYNREPSMNHKEPSPHGGQSASLPAEEGKGFHLSNEKATNPSKPKRSRPRDVEFEALVAVEGLDLSRLNSLERGRVNKALKAIREVFPHVTADEIKRRAANYRKRYPNAEITAMALACNWSKCESAPTFYHPQRGGTQVEQPRPKVMPVRYEPPPPAPANRKVDFKFEIN